MLFLSVHHTKMNFLNLFKKKTNKIQLPKSIHIYQDLPAITIKKHAQAKSLKLKVSSQGITLTTPVIVSLGQIEKFVLQSEDWLREQWQKYKSYQRQYKELDLIDYPEKIQVYTQAQEKLWQFNAQQHILYVAETHQQQAIKDFIVAYAKQTLPKILINIADELNIKINKISIRSAKTRWGSCSIEHNIMLNAVLVLCPKHLIRYVCIHELAHTVHFDHSPQFWQWVARYDPNYQQHRKELKEQYSTIL